MASNQAGQSPASDENDASLPYDLTSTSSSYDSSSAEEWGPKDEDRDLRERPEDGGPMTYEEGLEGLTEMMTAEELTAMGGKEEDSRYARYSRDYRRENKFMGPGRETRKAAYAKEIDKRDSARRRLARDLNLDRGKRDADEADDERDSRRKGRRAERRRARLLPQDATPDRIRDQRYRHVQRDARRDTRRGLRRLPRQFKTLTRVVPPDLVDKAGRRALNAAREADGLSPLRSPPPPPKTTEKDDQPARGVKRTRREKAGQPARGAKRPRVKKAAETGSAPGAPEEAPTYSEAGPSNQQRDTVYISLIPNENTPELDFSMDYQPGPYQQDGFPTQNQMPVDQGPFRPQGSGDIWMGSPEGDGDPNQQGPYQPSYQSNSGLYPGYGQQDQPIVIPDDNEDILGPNQLSLPGPSFSGQAGPSGASQPPSRQTRSGATNTRQHTRNNTAAGTGSGQSQTQGQGQGTGSGAQGSSGTGGGGRGGGSGSGGRGSRGASGSGGRRGGTGRGNGETEEAPQVPRQPAPTWRNTPLHMHPEVLEHFTPALEQGTLLPIEQWNAAHARIGPEVDRLLTEADEAAGRNHGREAQVTDRLVNPVPVERPPFIVDEWPAACNRCWALGLDGCNIAERGGKECDNCTDYRYNVANYPHSMDHDCKFMPGPNREDLTAERKKPDDMVIDFVHPLLWQCDRCAEEGRYCDADRLMSVKCTTCMSQNRECTVRRSQPLRERDYLRAEERGFRIMCRLCVKGGKKCSWVDSTADYNSGRPCPECLRFENDGSERFGACTTYSQLPLTAASGILTPLPIANILPALDDQGRPLFIQQREPWRTYISSEEKNKQRRQGNGAVLVFDGLYHRTKNPDSRPTCEFCWYTYSNCGMGAAEKKCACKTCTFLGMKCVDWSEDRNLVNRPRRVPRRWWNLANGMGYSARKGQWKDKFKHCANCRLNERTCDRKRPCESCQEHGEQCDNVVWGEGVFVADRHPGDRSNNYYLGMGYGPDGLGTPMLLNDPTRMACGPKHPHGDDTGAVLEDATSEQRRASRCERREEFLQDIYGDEYQPPGTGWFPPVLQIDDGEPDPTRRPGWPGSYIRNDREPNGARDSPERRAHPEGIAHYPGDAVAGFEGGAPAPDEIQQDPVHHPPEPPLPHQPPNEGDEMNFDDIFGQNFGQNPDADQWEVPDDLAGFENIINDVYGINGFMPPQGEQNQAPPIDNDEVMEDAFLLPNQMGPPDADNAALPENPPPGMNAFVPVQLGEEPQPPALPQNAAPMNPLDAFKLGDAFVNVERFMVRGYTGPPLTEDAAATEPAPERRGVQPTYPWSRLREEGDDADDDRTIALRQLENPGDNVLRDIPEESADVEYPNRVCKDRRAPGFPPCGAIDDHGICEDMRHPHDANGVFPVCSDCDMASKRHIWNKKLENGGIGITHKEIFMMRAYFCEECSKMASNPEYWHARGESVYGFEEAAREDADPAIQSVDARLQGGWKSEQSLSITGCNCATKLFDRVLCSQHRLFLAQKMIRQAAMMQEFRFRRYGKKICPMCLLRPGLDSSETANAPEMTHFWACLVCNGKVAQKEMQGTRQVELGQDAYAWYGGDLPQNLRDIGDFLYPRDLWEDDFAIEDPPKDSSEDGSGEWVVEDEEDESGSNVVEDEEEGNEE